MENKEITTNNLVRCGDYNIRRIYDPKTETWSVDFFDAVRKLMANDSGAYWKNFRQRLKKEENEVATFCDGLKLVTSDGKKYTINWADANKMFRIFESFPSSKDKRFKYWIDFKNWVVNIVDYAYTQKIIKEHVNTRMIWEEPQYDEEFSNIATSFLNKRSLTKSLNKDKNAQRLKDVKKMDSVIYL